MVITATLTSEMEQPWLYLPLPVRSRRYISVSVRPSTPATCGLLLLRSHIRTGSDVAPSHSARSDNIHTYPLYRHI